jgi:hypothetical protein
MALMGELMDDVDVDGGESGSTVRLRRRLASPASGAAEAHGSAAAT